jgi:hypothetical protein
MSLIKLILLYNRQFYWVKHNIPLEKRKLYKHNISNFRWWFDDKDFKKSF